MVQVKKEGERIKKPLEFQDPKTKKSKRTVPLAKDVIKALRAHKAGQAQEKLFHGQHYHNNDLVSITTWFSVQRTVNPSGPGTSTGAILGY